MYSRGRNSEVLEVDEQEEIAYEYFEIAAVYYGSHFFNTSVKEISFAITDYSHISFA